MASSRVAIVLGAGSNVGARVARQLTSDGYKVATVSRSGKGIGSNDVALSITADLADSSVLSGIFKEVRTKLSEPSVVVYNGRRLRLTRLPSLNRLIDIGNHRLLQPLHTQRHLIPYRSI